MFERGLWNMGAMKYIHTYLSYISIFKYNFFQLDSKERCYPNIQKNYQELAEYYRPISITGALSKVFAKLLYKEINEYLFSNNLLSNTQFGFRTSYWTMYTILYCTEIFRKSMVENSFVAVSL